MKSNPPLPRPHRSLFLVCVFAFGLTSMPGPATAQEVGEAQELVLPEPIEGYITERVDSVSWTYPAALRSRIAPLIEKLDEHWRNVVNDFGIIIDDDLEIRIARNPVEMRRLAPVDAPPPDYATGVAYPRWGVVLLTMSAPQTWEPPDLEVVLVHELSHVAFYRAVSGASVPLWFKEGVAIHQSEVRLLPRMESLLRAAAERSMLRLSELDRQFPTRPYDVNLAYAQSADVVGFMRKTSNDQRRFHRLIYSLRNGETFDTALATAYGWTRIGLERQWRENLRTRYRIVPALLAGSTVWVIAAVLVVFAYRRRRRYHHAKLQQMAYREELEAMRHTSAPPPPPIPSTESPSEGGVPIVEHDGESHTLH